MLCFAAAVPPRGADATMIDTAGLLTYLYVSRLLNFTTYAVTRVETHKKEAYSSGTVRDSHPFPF